jgi:hypothetical protein
MEWLSIRWSQSSIKLRGTPKSLRRKAFILSEARTGPMIMIMIYSFFIILIKSLLLLSLLLQAENLS